MSTSIATAARAGTARRKTSTRFWPRAWNFTLYGLMAVFLAQDPNLFVAFKIALTAGGVVLLTLVAKVRAFGRLPVSAILYTVLAGYAALIAYEVWLLRTIANS